MKIINSDISIQQKIDIHNNIAAEFRTSDSVKAFNHINRALKLSDSIGYEAGRVDALIHSGWVLITSSSYEDAREVLHDAVDLAISSENKKGEGEAYQVIGITYWYGGMYSPALEFYYKSLKISEDHNDKKEMARSLQNIGIISWNLGDSQKAEENILRAIHLFEDLDDPSGIAKGHSNLGVIYEEDGEYSKALDSYFKAQRILIEINNKRVLAYNYDNVGIIYDLQGDYAKSIHYYTLALNLFDEIGSKAERAIPLIDIGKSFIRQRKFSQARKYLIDGIDVAQESGFLASVRDGSENLAIVEEELGNYKAALESHVIFKTLSDSLTNEEQTSTLARLETEYKFSKERDSIQFANEREKFAINQQLEQKKNLQYFTVSGLVVLAILLFIVYRYYVNKRQANERLIVLNSEINMQRDELEKLNKAKTRFFSIIAHDIRNPMSTFLGFFDLMNVHLEEQYDAKKDDALKEMSKHLKNANDQLLELLDNLVKWALKEEGLMPHLPTSLDLHEYVEKICRTLQPSATAKQIVIKNEVGDGIRVWADKNSLMTILRNLTSNALKFTPMYGTIKLTAVLKDEYVEIGVHDTGIGIPEEKLSSIFEIDESKVSRGTAGEKGTGLGLNLVRDFVMVNKGDISVESTVDKGTKFTVSIPNKK